MTKKYLTLISLCWGLSAFAAEHYPEVFLQSIQGKPNQGQEIYTHFCATCHAPKPMINLGAPCVHNKAAWTPYLNHQTIDQMVKAIDEGVGNMPARGGCFECSDADLKAAIEFMIKP